MQHRESAYELRERLFEAVVKDLLGPAEGPDEEIAGTGIRDRYLVGQLAPRGMVANPEEYDDVARAGAGTAEEGQPDTETPPARTLMPSSIGLTFCRFRSGNGHLGSIPADEERYAAHRIRYGEDGLEAVPCWRDRRPGLAGGFGTT
jgi:hypothetical protein